MSGAEELRAQVGVGAMEAFELLDAEFVEAFEEYGPHLARMADALQGWPLEMRVQFLSNLAIKAALAA